MYWDGERDDELLEWLWAGGCNYMFIDSQTFIGTEQGRPSHLSIHTLEGVMEVSPGDWVIKGVVGEFYPCRGDIFENTYEMAGEGDGE